MVVASDDFAGRVVAAFDDDPMTVDLLRSLLRGTQAEFHSFLSGDAITEFLVGNSLDILFVSPLVARIDSLGLVNELLANSSLTTTRIFLWSATRLPAAQAKQVANAGIQLLSKDILFDKALFLSELRRPSGALNGTFLPRRHFA